MTTPKINLREPQTLVRVLLGVLLAANIVAAIIAFHLIGESPADLEAQLTAGRAGLRTAQQTLNQTKSLAGNMDLSREQGNIFLSSYMTSRRRYSSALGGELNKVAGAASMKVGLLNFSQPEPIEGSDDMDSLTITASFVGGYAQLVKFVNLLDRSPRFLLIDTFQVEPQPKGDILSATVKMNAFLKDDKGVAQ
jgi:Tfp pilus assembly protein PilO